MQTTFDRSIQYDHGDYKMTLDGRYVGHRSTYSQAEHALDEMVYDMLIHGDCNTAEELDGSQCGGSGCVDGCIDCMSSELDPPIDIPDEYPDPTPGGPPPPERAFPTCSACFTNVFPPSSLRASTCIACANAQHFGLGNRFEANARAVTLQSLLIDQTMRRCLNCGGAHRTWQCPEVARRLFAQDTAWKDIALGRELCRMRWCNFKAFRALLSSLSPEHLSSHAKSYIAFIRSYRPDSDLTISQVLEAWGTLVDRGSAALRVAA